MREPDAGVVELDHALTDGKLEPGTNPVGASVRRRDHLGRRSGERSSLEQNIEGLAGQASQSAAEHPLLTTKDTASRAAVLLITSDRGLAGAYSSNVLKEGESL